MNEQHKEKHKEKENKEKFDHYKQEYDSVAAEVHDFSHDDWDVIYYELNHGENVLIRGKKAENGYSEFHLEQRIDTDLLREQGLWPPRYS